MRNFVFQNPTKVIFGSDTIGKIGSEIKKTGIKKVLVLYGKGSIFKNGVYDSAIASLKENDITYAEMGGVKANPILSLVYEGIEKIKNEQAEGILALGGGSVIDSAKAMAVGAVFEGDIWKVFEGKGRVRAALPIFTVLTISATGSEMNSSAVITKEEEHKKWAFGSLFTFPRVSIIDPSVQFTLPKEQTINGAVDTMSHVFELYFEGTPHTDIVDEFSEGILRTTMKHVQILLCEPENYDSRAELAWSSTLALNGSNSTGRTAGDWASHGIEHAVSAFFDISHGAGLAIIFPAWMKYTYREDVGKFVRLAEKVFHITEGTEEERAVRGIDALKDFYRNIGAPVTLKELDIPYEDLEKIADNASLLAPLGQLKKLYKEDILEILKLAYE